MRRGRRAPLLIETDVLVAAINPEDPHHGEAGRVIELAGSCSLSPYALLELDLLIRSGNVAVRDYQLFWRKLRALLDYYRVPVLAPDPLHHAEAGRLRSLYNLTYFDSLHAAAAIVEGVTLVSYDERAYSKVESLKYSHPRSITRGLEG